jgi:hypothetical protein
VTCNFLEDLSVNTLFDVFFGCIIENGRSTTYSNRKSIQKNNINIKNHSILLLCHLDCGFERHQTGLKKV